MSASSRCPICSAPLSQGDRFCGRCGQPASASSAFETIDSPSRASLAREARFLPGVVIAGRYRIAGFLGRGGMGEVYRADDLKLGQPVALKFLPPGIERDAARLRRFLDEVRTARQVSHTSVCRIHDVGEAEGQHFLSMEYIDGEDLASLLRRIGRLPAEKAIQIARQLCAGLAASHAIGLLHRDLKPSNLMIDGRGRARITDFGLAGFANAIEGADIRAGTPAYMAPEQLSGREVSVRSDIYALGLVLYELFTGQPAFHARSVDDLRRLHAETTPAAPSRLVTELDPAVERTILRCLEPDPLRRPASAIAVSAGLPGGDPLAAALAAGETPSPELVAEAGGEAVPRRLAWGALASFLVALLGFLELTSRTSLLGIVRLDKPPEVLRERAREILALAGHESVPGDSLYAFDANHDYLEALRQAGLGRMRLDVLPVGPPGRVLFWHRESPSPLVGRDRSRIGAWLQDPTDSAPGMARVGLDPEGRLVSLLVVPAERTAAGPGGTEPDWQPLLRATGVDTSSLAPVPPELSPPVFADRRAAWTGFWPGKPDVPLRIEAGAAGGRCAWLQLVLTGSQSAGASSPPQGLRSRVSELAGAVAVVLVFGAAGLIALHNVRRGRGDRRRALRFALYLGAARFAWFLGAHHVAAAEEVRVFGAHFAYAMGQVGLAYVFYLALEPFARRLWPRMLVSWVRVLDGRFRDPLVGRDLLVGAAAGSLIALVTRLAAWLPGVFGGASAMPTFGPWTFEPLRGSVAAIVSVVAIHSLALYEIIFPVTALLFFRLLLRRTAPALVAVSLLGTLLFLPESGSVAGYAVGTAVTMLILWGTLFRFGLLAFAAIYYVLRLLEELPFTLAPPDWYRGAMLLALVFVAAPAVWGFWQAVRSQPRAQA